MSEDLLDVVTREIQSRKGRWPQIAAALAPEISYSFIEKIGRGSYGSDPSYKKLKLLHEYFRAENAAA